MSSPEQGRLRAALRSGRFAVTAEIGPPRGADAQAIVGKADLLRDWVDAANITDNQGSHTRLASWAGSILAMRSGVEPVMQLTTRDRNRIALQSDLISAGAVGIPNVLMLSGDHPTFGDHPDAMPVFDLDSVQLIWTARLMRDQGRLLSGKPVRPAPQWLIGAVENPFAPPLRFRAQRMAKKVAAGAEFIQTQFVFDLEIFSRWMGEVTDLGLEKRCGVIAGVGPIRTVRAMEFMQSKVPGIHIPDQVVRRLRGVTSDQVAAEGMALCVETIEALREMTAVAGVHVMAFGQEHVVPELLERAGVPPRTATAPSATAGSNREDHDAR
ncbi:MAG: methylenetetrahydrofolate reductase [Geodermatophilaceae bacterium]|nr:methylenetetrahydrofolate reductase [Geodermatophilaceae bacterium]